MPKKKNKVTKKHMATTKAIGLVVAVSTVIVAIFSMSIIAILSVKAIDMGISPDFTPLNTLMGGVLALATAYIGFYINMAKAEHIEDKKNEIAKEIRRIEKDGVTPEEEIELENLKSDLEELDKDLEEIKLDNTQIDIKSYL